MSKLIQAEPISKSHILVVDDEPSICWAFRELLTDEGHEVSATASVEEAFDLIGRQRPDAIVLDVRLPGMDGLTGIRHLRERLGEVPIIIITAFGNLQTAVKAVEEGAFDYLAKPFDLDQAADVVRRALGQRQTHTPPLAEPPSSPDLDGLIGSSLPMQQVFKQIALVATSQVPVLITGESGTGKELVARAIHRHSARRAGPFVPVSLAALNTTVIESELFGHVKGAFTGADVERTGLLELSHGGTVLLDEIGDVPLAVQVKLLRAIEQRDITPVGGTQSRQSDFRVVAATNRLLAEMIGRGDFREDLFFRLSVFHIEMPPLRERVDDIPLLAEFFLRQLGESHAHKQFTPAGLQELRSRYWPGNVRELRNAVERAAIMARGEWIDVEHLPQPLDLHSDAHSQGGTSLAQSTGDWAARKLATLGASVENRSLYEELLAAIEPTLLERVLDHCGQNRTAAARLLGLHRATLREKLRRHGLDDGER